MIPSPTLSEAPTNVGHDWPKLAMWLCRRMSLMDGRHNVLTPSEIQTFGKNLQSQADLPAAQTNLQSPLNDYFKQLGLGQRAWLKKPSLHRLPMLAAGRQTGLMLVLAWSNEHKAWVVETPQGRQELPELPADLAFCPVALGWTEQLDRGALGVLLGILTAHRQPFGVFLVSTLVINVLAVLTSLYSMQIYDRVIPSRGVETLIVLTAGVLIAYVFDLALKFTRSLIMERVVQEVDVDMSHQIFDRLLRVRMDQFPPSVGTLASQLRSYESIRAFAYSVSSYALVDTPFAILFLGMILFIGGPWVAGVPLVFLFISLAVGFAIKRRTEQHVRISQASANRKLGLLVETVECAEAVKSQGLRTSVQNRWNTLTHQNITEDRRVRHLAEATTYYAMALQQVSYVIMIATGAYLAATTNSLTAGGLIACSILSGRVLQPVTALPGILSQWANAKVALSMIDAIFKLQTDHHGTTAPLALSQLEGRYTFENVVQVYPGQMQGLQIPKLQIEKGEKIGIIGGIGSGKTTLLKLLAGLYKPSDGRVLIDGLDIQQVSRAHLSEHIGYMQQSVQLLSGTLKEYLSAGLPGLTDDDIVAACKATGLIQYCASHPKGLDLPITEGGNGVSGGQRQLIAMTRLLLQKPSVWLIDEPTANMDDETERRVITTLTQTVKADQTVVLISHKMSLLSLVQRLIVMNQGRIVLDGPRDAVLEHLRKSNAPQPQATAAAAQPPAGAAPAAPESRPT